MLHTIIQMIIIFTIAALMTMTGRGGGNFYVLAIVLFGVPMHQAATTGQFILTVSALFATLFFGSNRVVEWKLVISIGSITAIAAFFGGLFSQHVPEQSLKFVFSFFLLIAAFLMLRPKKEIAATQYYDKGYWKLTSNEMDYYINLKLAIPLVIIAGFGSGMVGVSGGSFLVPLMVLACNVPMRIAVGTSTTMVATTALMGFLGHTISGHFDIKLAIPLALAAAAGGIIGSKMALKSKPGRLKLIFAYTTLAASIIMVINAMMSN